jgi:hypothetical protein
MGATLPKPTSTWLPGTCRIELYWRRAPRGFM